MATPIVVLDPGHGPLSNPYPAASGFYEGTQMYKLANFLAPRLTANGIKVIITRKTISENPTLEARGKVAGANKADLFISLHSDAVGNGIASARGVSVFYSIQDTTKNKAFAAGLASTVSTLLETRNRGAQIRTLPYDTTRDYYGVIRSSAASGCKNAFLIEHGFHTSTIDVKWLITDDNLKKIADAEAKYICSYFGIAYKADGVTETPAVPDETMTDDMSATAEKVTIYKTLNKYTSAANAISADESLSVGILSIGTYYVYKKYGDATNLTKTAGVPGAWVVIGDAASANTNMGIADSVSDIEKFNLESRVKIYTNSEFAYSKTNWVTTNGNPVYYEPGEYYIYKKKTSTIINISKVADRAGAWINLDDVEKDTKLINKGDVVVFESNVALKYTDGTVIPTTVIATVCGKKETVVVSFDDENVKLSGLEKTVPINIIKVIMKATEASIAKANQESSKTETEIDKDDIAEVLKAKFGSLEALAKTQGYADFIEYMKTIVDDDIDFNEETDFEAIMGASVLNAQQLTTYIQKNNPDFDPKIADAFIRLGKIYGIRGDVACCQSILETGWFKFIGSSVKPEQHNYCGLGATGGGVAGCSFPTIDQGVEAQLQHLYAYACKADIPSGRTLYDPRFRYVARGIAPRWVDLNLRWCTGADYGEKILSIYKKALIK